MREAMEALLYSAGADIVLAGHIHAYERSLPVFEGVPNACGAVHLTLGDGGNREGSALPWREPPPAWSAFREGSFGVGALTLLNATHARFNWTRVACEVRGELGQMSMSSSCESEAIGPYAFGSDDRRSARATSDSTWIVRASERSAAAAGCKRPTSGEWAPPMAPRMAPPMVPPLPSSTILDVDAPRPTRVVRVQGTGYRAQDIDAPRPTRVVSAPTVHLAAASSVHLAAASSYGSEDASDEMHMHMYSSRHVSTGSAARLPPGPGSDWAMGQVKPAAVEGAQASAGPVFLPLLLGSLALLAALLATLLVGDLVGDLVSRRLSRVQSAMRARRLARRHGDGYDDEQGDEDGQYVRAA